MEAMKKFPAQAKVRYEMGAERPGHNKKNAICQGVGKDGEMAVLLDQ
jgi:hypothetical protein